MRLCLDYRGHDVHKLAYLCTLYHNTCNISVWHNHENSKNLYSWKGYAFKIFLDIPMKKN